MAIQAPYYPIVYVRGYAATMSEIEETVATPYMGFNLGSTKLRQDYENSIRRFIFESPLIRLMKDERYVDAYRGGDLVPENESVKARSVWIFRYYEGEDTEEVWAAERSEIIDFAKRLRRFILRIRGQVCGDDPAEKKKFKVHLVAHSMGGLICRTYLQNVCRSVTDAGLELGPRKRDPLVAKVFTYATPHNGIDMAGFNVPDLGALDRLHVRNFNRNSMRKYLKVKNASTPVSSLDGAFPVERFFCLVGTNYRDYDAFLGLSKRGTGPMSDGLVMMANAAVKGAPRAFVHRSHSGHYGIVNSEEGYQNLRRFLFGQVRVEGLLLTDEITLPPDVQKMKDKGRTVRARYNVDLAAKVRGAGYYVSERRVSQASALRRKYEDLVEGKRRIYLFTGYLHRGAKMKYSGDSALAFAIEIAIEVPMFEIDRKFWFDDFYEGNTLFNDTVTLHLRRSGNRTTVRYGLASRHGAGQAPRLAPDAPAGSVKGTLDEGGRVLDIPLGFKEGAVATPCPGFRGRLRLIAAPWQ